MVVKFSSTIDRKFFTARTRLGTHAASEVTSTTPARASLRAAMAIVVDHVRQRIVWVGEGKSSATLGEFFKALGPERAKLLTHVTMDLSAAFRASVTAHAPQAELVFDRFHIQRLASDAVDAVRRSEVRATESAVLIEIQHATTLV